jgi:hypothetical protein
MRWWSASLVLVTAMQVGCATGYDRLLFATRTNVGLDIDTKPPTAELSVARREGVIEPTFQEGQTLPVLAGFRFDGNWFNPKISSAFSGGMPALILGHFFTDATPTQAQVDSANLDATVCLEKNPGIESEGDSLWSKFWRWFGEKSDPVRPFFFATDTAYGLKVAWSGTSGAAPDTLKLGYNRKEFAYAPVFARAVDQCGGIGGGTQPVYQVETPEFIAIVDNSAKTTEGIEAGGAKHSQFFATGAAASSLARRREIRQVLYEKMVPEAAAAVQQAAEREEFRAHFARFSELYDARSDAQKEQVVELAKTELDFPDSTNRNNLKARVAASEGSGAEGVENVKKLNAFMESL